MKWDDLRVVRINLDTEEGKSIREKFGLGKDVKEFVRAYFLGELKEAGADGEKPVLVSTNDVDRMGDIVEPKGAQLENFRKNPVILWAHSYHLPPIGSAQWIKRTANGVLAKVRWASNEFAQSIRDLYTEGHMKAWSIGFIPKEWEDFKEKIDGEDRRGRRYKKWELLEFSAVPVPANPNALSLAVAKGLKVSEAIMAELGITVTDTGKAKAEATTPIPVIIATDTPDKVEDKDPDFSWIWDAIESADFEKELEDEEIQAVCYPDDDTPKQERPPTKVQTLIFNKEVYKTTEAAKKWAKDHDFKSDKVDETEDSFRLRQRNPSDFVPNSFRTITLDKGIKAVIGRLKKAIEETDDQIEKLRGELSDAYGKVDALLNENKALKAGKDQSVITIKIEDKTGEEKASDEPVIRIEGATITKSELEKVIREAIDGRIKAMTGVVS